MIRTVIGALFGAEIDRQRGSSGVKGAAIGTLATIAMRRMGPLGLVLGAGYVAKKAWDRRHGEDQPKTDA